MLDVFVSGVPRTKGSLHVRNRSTGSLVGDRLERQWAGVVKSKVAQTWGGRSPIAAGVPVTIQLRFVMPTDSVTTNGPGAGDLDKLIRSVLDAITQAKVWADDVQVVEIRASKVTLNDHVAVAWQKGLVSGVYIQIDRAVS